MKFEVRNGSFAYGRKKRIFNDVSFTLEEPQILSVLGANGAGKTTMMRCMLGLLPWSAGASYLDGTDIRRIPSKKLWKTIGYVPQAKLSSFVYTVEEMVVLGRSSHLGPFGQPGERDRQIVEECLEMTGIAHLKGKLCSRLSGGEFQMVMIARALAGEPSLLVLDEPESNLDFKNQQVVLETIRALCEKRGIAAIINTHFPEHAPKFLINPFFYFSDGTALAGETAQVITEENMTRAFDINVRIRDVQVAGRGHTCVFPVLNG